MKRILAIILAITLFGLTILAINPEASSQMSGTISASAEWQVVDTWSASISAPGPDWTLVESWSASLSALGPEPTPNKSPVADFSYSPSKPTNYDNIQFYDESTDSDGTVELWNWSFGDGTVSTKQNPVHSYENADNYTVSLTVTDDGGESDTINKNISVGEPDWLGKESTSLSISPSSFSLKAGESKELTATLTSNGSPLVGKTLNWTAEKGYFGISSLSTNSLGQVSVIYTAPDQPATSTVSVSFPGNDAYLSSEASSVASITKESSIKVNVEFEPDILQIGGERKWVKCYIEPTESDANQINANSVLLGGSIKIGREGVTEVSDHDQDGKSDLMIRFEKSKILEYISPGIITLSVTGEIGEDTFSGKDKIDVFQTGVGMFVSIRREAIGSEPKLRENVFNPKLNLETIVNDNAVMLVLESEIENMAGETIAVNLDNHSVSFSSMDNLMILFDNQEIERADNYADVLDPHNDGIFPEYFVLMGSEGIQVLVSIPQFSTHTITIANSTAKLPKPPSEPPIPFFVIVIIAVLVVILILFWIWKYTQPKEGII
ncbi:MAG: PKD domain-containing protein [Hadesarchaea archaeon]|nr:PKD domain-containing protein [Hadesarchaea archaeon]